MAEAVHLICGLPGAGKSTYSESLRESLGGLRFSIDEWNARLFFMDREPTADFDWFYERVQRSCALMRDMAEQAIAVGTPAIFDCGLTNSHERRTFYDWADAQGFSTRLHVIEAPSELRWQRVERRNADKGETFALTVTREMFDFMDRIWEPPTLEEIASRAIETVDTSL